MTFEEARAQFPVLERYAYLNAGTNGPLARATVDAMTEFDLRDLERGRGGNAYFEETLALRERAREALAGVLEVAPENVALVSSTTNACNVVLAGDFNVPAARSATQAELTSEEWGFSEPVAEGIDQILVRGASVDSLTRWPRERRLVDGRVLSDHTPVEARVA